MHKTNNKFSAMAFNYCNEQNNATVKDSGGAIGLTTNPMALRSRMVADPEVSRIITDKDQRGGHLHLHHDQQPSVLKSLIAVFEEMGNPFLEKSQDLLVLDTRDIMDTSVVETVQRVETIGEEQYKNYVEERLEKCEMPITEMITKNKLALFRTPVKHQSSKQKMEVTALKNNCSLFPDCSYLVRLEMETWTGFSTMKTRQLHHHCQSEAKSD